MINITDLISSLESWRGSASISLAVAVCAAGAYFWDGDAVHAAMLLAVSFVLAGMTIPLYRYDKKHHSG